MLEDGRQESNTAELSYFSSQPQNQKHSRGWFEQRKDPRPPILSSKPCPATPTRKNPTTSNLTNKIHHIMDLLKLAKAGLLNSIEDNEDRDSHDKEVNQLSKCNSNPDQSGFLIQDDALYTLTVWKE